MSECLHNVLSRASVDGRNWFWRCQKPTCGAKFQIAPLVIREVVPEAEHSDRAPEPTES